MNRISSYAKPKNTNRLLPLDYLVVLVCLLLIPSGVARGLIGINERTAFALFVPAVFAGTLIGNRIKADKVIPFVVLLIGLTGALASVLSESLSQVLMAASLMVAVVVGRQLYVTLRKPPVLHFASWLTLVLLVGGVIGIAYSMAGGASLLDVQVGYRTTHLFLTTFSFASIGSIIRPSGIFDEPGSFAMYVSLVTIFNDTLRQNPKLNTVIVALLLSIGSLAGVALVILFALTSNAARAYRKKSLAILGLFLTAYMGLSIVAPSNIVTMATDIFYSDRFQVEEGRLRGDNRSMQVAEFFSIVDSELLLRGAKDATQLYDTEDQTSNPFSIVYGYGLLISVPYFALLIWLTATTVRQRFSNSYGSLGLLLLLLQRPYLYNMSWSILILAAVWLVYDASRVGRKRTGAY